MLVLGLLVGKLGALAFDLGTLLGKLGALAFDLGTLLVELFALLLKLGGLTCDAIALHGELDRAAGEVAALAAGVAALPIDDSPLTGERFGGGGHVVALLLEQCPLACDSF